MDFLLRHLEHAFCVTVDLFLVLLDPSEDSLRALLAPFGVALELVEGRLSVGSVSRFMLDCIAMMRGWCDQQRADYMTGRTSDMLAAYRERPRACSVSAS